MTQRAAALEIRFWRYVDSSGGVDSCWPWTGSKSQRGYGRIWSGLVRTPGRKLRVATQVSWEIANERPFPPGLFACHSCDNPPCVNPAHIWPGTCSENMCDARDKGRLVTPAAWRPGRTHCKNGHAYTPENVRLNAKGWRMCRACGRDNSSNLRARRRPK